MFMEKISIENFSPGFTIKCLNIILLRMVFLLI